MFQVGSSIVYFGSGLLNGCVGTIESIDGKKYRVKVYSHVMDEYYYKTCGPSLLAILP